MFLFIVCGIIVGFLCYLILLELCECTKIDDTSEVDNTVLGHVSTKVDIEKHNAQVEQQWITEQQKAQQHISSILDKAYKDYISSRIKNNGYIYREFTLCKGDYGITYNEILAITQPFTYSIYSVKCYYSNIFHEHIIKVAVDYQRKED